MKWEFWGWSWAMKIDQLVFSSLITFVGLRSPFSVNVREIKNGSRKVPQFKGVVHS